MAPFLVRPMRHTDVAEVRALMYRSVREDFGQDPDPAIHADIDDLEGWYLADGAPFMLVVEDAETGALLGSGGIRAGALKPGLSPEHLVRRYEDAATGQIVRVYVLREHRRGGIAAAVVQAVLQHARERGHYSAVAFHTYQHSPGAVAFWTSTGAQLVLDDTEGISGAMYYEIPLDGRTDPVHPMTETHRHRSTT